LASLDYASARAPLNLAFAEVEKNLTEQRNRTVTIPEDIEVACDAVFDSRTQAYREVLLGCLLARIQDRTINIHSPYE